jgi:hypothetical protein
MTEEWKALTDVQKVPYDNLSNNEKQRYEREMKVYKEKKAKEGINAAAAAATAVASHHVVKEDKVLKKRPASAAAPAEPAKKGKALKVAAPVVAAPVDKKVKEVAAPAIKKAKPVTKAAPKKPA